jgi:hypothetical protein
MPKIKKVGIKGWATVTFSLDGHMIPFKITPWNTYTE